MSERLSATSNKEQILLLCILSSTFKKTYQVNKISLSPLMVGWCSTALSAQKKSYIVPYENKVC